MKAKKILALILTMALCLSLAPAVFAEETTEASPAAASMDKLREAIKDACTEALKDRADKAKALQEAGADRLALAKALQQTVYDLGVEEAKERLGKVVEDIEDAKLAVAAQVTLATTALDLYKTAYEAAKALPAAMYDDAKAKGMALVEAEAEKAKLLSEANIAITYKAIDVAVDAYIDALTGGAAPAPVDPTPADPEPTPAEPETPSEPFPAPSPSPLPEV